MVNNDAARAERLQQLFLAAVQIVDPEERANFLRRECSNDSDLPGEVESMVAADCAEDSFLEQPAAAAFLPNAQPYTETPPFGMAANFATPPHGQPTASTDSLDLL